MDETATAAINFTAAILRPPDTETDVCSLPQDARNKGEGARV
jgi:hypothetical protein